MKTYYLKKADENLPKLNKHTVKPTVNASVLKSGDSVTVDLGEHYVGYFSFNMQYVDVYIDAPVRMSVRFCESARELCVDNTDYRGRLCESWLQEEIINVDLPGIYKMPRRYAARYIKITVLHTPQKLTLSDLAFEAVTSADTERVSELKINDGELLKIDKVAVNTLKNCMQRVFEDGPKRDRRLWIGDLRLEALANGYTFQNTELLKRCLYLFAAADRNESGFMPGCVYEDPAFVSGDWFLLDYSLMYVCTLCDHYLHTDDSETFNDLFSVLSSVMEATERTRDGRGIVTLPKGTDGFIDWCPGLKKNASLHGVYLYTLALWCEALERLKYPETEKWRTRLSEGREAARAYLFDADKNAFLNEADGMQYSVHSAVWLILGGVISGDNAREILLNVLNSKESVKPFTPYMHHYAVEALIKLGMMTEAEKYLRDIWGGMVKAGADTFFEVYVPNDPDFSPYGDWRVNSMCHAWSCTATYFIRKYGFGETGVQTTRKR